MSRNIKIKFGLREFHNFAHDIEREWGLESIRFRTSHDSFFDSEGRELSHLAKSDPFEEGTFTGKLSKHLETIKWFSFSFYKNDGSKSLIMKFDLENGVAVLEETLSINQKIVKRFLLNNMVPKKSYWWDWLFRWFIENLWKIIIGVVIAIIVRWVFIQLGWV